MRLFCAIEINCTMKSHLFKTSKHKEHSSKRGQKNRYFLRINTIKNKHINLIYKAPDKCAAHTQHSLVLRNAVCKWQIYIDSK